MGIFDFLKRGAPQTINADAISRIGRHYLKVHTGLADQIKCCHGIDKKAETLGSNLLYRAGIDLDVLIKNLKSYDMAIIDGRELNFILGRIAIYLNDTYLSLEKSFDKNTAIEAAKAALMSSVTQMMSTPGGENISGEKVLDEITNSADRYIEAGSMKSALDLHCAECYKTCVVNGNYMIFKMQLQMISGASHVYYNQYVLPALCR